MPSELGRALMARRVAAAAIVAVAVVLLGIMLTAVPGTGAWELGVDRLLIAHVPANGHVVATGVGVVLEPVGGCCIAVVVAAVVWWRSEVRRAMRFVVTVVVPWLSVEPVKLLVHRPRPTLPGLPIDTESWSYPSGHVALATALVLGLVAVTRGRARVWVFTVGSIAVVGVMVSRLVLGVHYPSDVMAAAAWVSAVWVITCRIMAGVAAVRRRRAPIAGTVPTLPTTRPLPILPSPGVARTHRGDRA